MINWAKRDAYWSAKQNTTLPADHCLSLWIKSMNCEPYWQDNVEMRRNPELHWVGNDDIFGEYIVLQSWREQWTITDLHTEAAATLFWCNKSCARVSQSEVWIHSGPGWQKWSRRWILLFLLSWSPAASKSWPPNRFTLTTAVSFHRAPSERTRARCILTATWRLDDLKKAFFSSMRPRRLNTVWRLVCCQGRVTGRWL